MRGDHELEGGGTKLTGEDEVLEGAGRCGIGAYDEDVGVLEGVLARLCPQAQLPVKALRVGVWAVDGCRYWDSVLHLRRESVLDRHGGQNVGERTREEEERVDPQLLAAPSPRRHSRQRARLTRQDESPDCSLQAHRGHPRQRPLPQGRQRPHPRRRVRPLLVARRQAT